jgi:hypothetical protein
MECPGVSLAFEDVMKVFAILELKLFEMLERRRVRRTFEEYVSPDVMKLIKADTNDTRFPISPERRHFQFVVVHFDEIEAEQISAILTNVTEVLLDHGAVISNVSSCLVIAWLGEPFAQYDSVERRLKLVTSLLARNGRHIRLAHGQCNGILGNFGSPRRFSYGVHIPGFSEILRRLLDTPLGRALEIA